MFDVISKAEALEKGFKRYFTGVPCRNGGVGQRDTKTGGCRCEICKAKRYAGERKRVESNKDKTAAYMKAWGKINREAKNAASLKSRNKNIDKARTASREYYIRNKDNYRSAKAKRRAIKNQRLPVWFGEFDKFVVSECAILASIRTEETGINWHVDHMVPLQAKKASGLHCAVNLQVIPAVMNLKKHNRMVITDRLEWLKNGI